MQNGQDIPTAHTAPTPPVMRPVQINPAQAAAFALEFLERADHKRSERERFDVAQALLTAIMHGSLVLGPPSAVAASPPASDASPLQ